ncbi:MAG: hypothetical protein ACUVSU_06910 [Aggregatilineaceae bacterium]
MIKAYPVSNPTVPPYKRFSLILGPEGICQIQLHLPLSGALAEQIAAEVEQLLQEHPDVRGLLLDMRESIPLSIVRLDELIDRLGTLNLPVAVLFSEERYQETATLLHHTLVRRPRVAYFTDPEAARAYLHAPTNGDYANYTASKPDSP